MKKATLVLFLITLILGSCATTEDLLNENIEPDIENTPAIVAPEEIVVTDQGLVESLQFQPLGVDESYKDFGIRGYWVHAEYPFVEEFYSILENLVGGSNWYPQDGNSTYIRRIGDRDFPVDLFQGIDLELLDELTKEYGVVFWQHDPETLFISITDLATFEEQLTSNPLLQEMLDRIARNPVEGSFGVDVDSDAASDPNINNIQQSSFDTLMFDKLTLVNDPEISKYAFMYFFPSSLKRDSAIRTLVVGNGLPGHDSYDALAFGMQNNAETFSEYCEEYGYVMIKLLIPGQAQYMLEEYMLTDLDSDDPLARPDLEIRSIIVGFLERARAERLDMHSKVFITGFSNGGIQANVFPLLHPDLVEATAIGAAGAYTFPISSISGRELNYQIGIANIQAIDGNHFSLDEYTTVEHFIFVGESDIHNDPVSLYGGLADFYMANFGMTTRDRVPVFAEIVNSVGGSAEFKIYPGVGHGWENEMIDDTFEFFSKVPLSN